MPTKDESLTIEPHSIIPKAQILATHNKFMDSFVKLLRQNATSISFPATPKLALQSIITKIISVFVDTLDLDAADPAKLIELMRFCRGQEALECVTRLFSRIRSDCNLSRKAFLDMLVEMVETKADAPFNLEASPYRQFANAVITAASEDLGPRPHSAVLTNALRDLDCCDRCRQVQKFLKSERRELALPRIGWYPVYHITRKLEEVIASSNEFLVNWEVEKTRREGLKVGVTTEA